MTRVILCDDHTLVRTGLRAVLTEDPSIDVVADLGTATEAVAAAGELLPNVVIMDIGLPDSSGISAISRVLDVSPHSKVLMLTMHDDVAYLREAFTAGAMGYVLKAAAGVELIQAVHEVASGKRYVHPILGAALLADDTTTQDAQDTQSPLPAGLSDREAEILRLLALGYTNPEMANMMQLSVRTVETYRYRLQQKVGLRSRAELARLAREAGLVT
jgi:two-component system response regulator NreC